MMKEEIYLITNNSRDCFLCRNSKGRYFGKPLKIKDIIHYPTKGNAEMITKYFRGDYSIDRQTKDDMMVIKFNLELNENTSN